MLSDYEKLDLAIKLSQLQIDAAMLMVQCVTTSAGMSPAITSMAEGLKSDMEALEKLCRDNGVPVVTT